jgi:hypothetical protein
MWNDALPRQGITNWSTFYAAQSATTTDSWQTWMKPAGCAWIYILAIASGNGGGRSNNGALTVAAGGGLGGASARLLIPAFVVPDILYVRVGRGGIGATTPGNGGAGINTFVSMQANTTTANLIVSQQANAGGGIGGATTGLDNGTASQFATTPAIFCTSLVNIQAGTNGATGGATQNTAGTGVTQSSTSITSGGCGGGNGTGAGGNIINGVVYPTITGGSGSTGGAGQNGFQLGAMWTPGLKTFPLTFSGGSGGGGSSAVGGTAGNGGHGSYGGGGGGGGSCTDAGGTSGNGGNGGDGIVFIGAF